MHKNRIIIILGIFIFFLASGYLGFTPNTKRFLIEISSAAIVFIALFIERKGFFSLQWRKKNTTTSVAHTYIERNGNKNIIDETDIISVTNSSEE